MNMQKINDEIIQELKSLNWQKVINYGNSLDDLNEPPWRMNKGTVVELLVENCNPEIKHQPEKHKDFIWEKYNYKIECKSLLSEKFYLANGNLNPKQKDLKFSNSNGTNNKDALQADEICDILLIIKNDGVCIMDEESILRNLRKTGDGFILETPVTDLIEISGKLTVTEHINLQLKEKILATIKEAIK